MLRFLSVIRHKRVHHKHASIEKAQHLWRWISLQTFTRGRLVPRQPRAIKNTTRTELPHEGIYIAKFIHWDNSAIPTQLRDETIVGVAWLTMKGKTKYGKSSCDLPYFTAWNDANYAMICVISRHNVMAHVARTNCMYSANGRMACAIVGRW